MARYTRIKEILNKTLIDDVAMILLALLSVSLLILETNSDLSSSQTRILDITDISIASIFLVEWLARFQSADKKAEFFKKYWWELLASIPIPSDFAQALRALRILRVLRILRLAVRLKRISEISDRLSKHHYAIQILVVFLSITFIASMIFDTFERGFNQNVHNTWDSFWWAMVTATTIGYGDIYPVTNGGRIVAIFLMIFGIGTLGLLTAKIASTIIREER